MVISAVGFPSIKQSRDPPAGVQKLDFLNMVSEVQRLTAQFFPNDYAST